jgi:hypothetical protein
MNGHGQGHCQCHSSTHRAQETHEKTAHCNGRCISNYHSRCISNCNSHCISRGGAESAENGNSTLIRGCVGEISPAPSPSSIPNERNERPVIPSELRESRDLHPLADVQIPRLRSG